jgi:hypothetical protein
MTDMEKLVKEAEGFALGKVVMDRVLTQMGRLLGANAPNLTVGGFNKIIGVHAGEEGHCCILTLSNGYAQKRITVWEQHIAVEVE